MSFLYIYLISIPVFIFFDLLWLGLVAKNFYQKRLGYLLGEVNWVVAIIFYLLFLLGMSFFVTVPAIIAGDILKALIMGSAFGCVTYATYDLTNQATIKKWPVSVTIVDMVWGTFLGGAVAVLTFVIYGVFI